MVFLLVTLAFGADAVPQPEKAWTVPAAKGAEIRMAWIKPGTFTMGSPESEPGRKADEAQFQVTLTHGYWLSTTEVTVAQWRDVMGTDLRAHLTKVIKDDTLYDFSGRQRTIRDFMAMKLETINNHLANEDDGLPMYFTSWNDAMEFSAKLTEREKKEGRLPAGYKYSLPTEAQWERAVRAGTSDATWKGPVSAGVDDVAWFSGNSTEGYTGKNVGRTNAGPRLAGQKKPNPWGLHDMTGNLWEWCLDWYGPYPTGNVTDPKGPETGTLRVNRGGSFGSGANAARSAARATNPPAEASAWRGFRVALIHE